ncbi:MAG: Zn-dependent hydrolase [Phototrophicaceae bacterium]
MLTINRDRFLGMMQTQATIGATEDGGVTRPSLSEADIAVRKWFREQIESNGLIYQMDGAGNQSGILKSSDPHAKTLMIGSHLDSVPNGGRYDGPLGVISALEAVLTLKDAGQALPFDLEIINFTDEEGSLVGLLGSGAITGNLHQDSLTVPRGGRATLEAGMARIGISDASILAAKRKPDTIAGYIEVHIEQGTRLEEAQVDIGVVTSIVGIRSLWLVFDGEAAHAGTKPMAKRKDAFWGASQFAVSAKAHIIEHFHPGVVNFGAIELSPGAFNIVPNQVRLGVEFRHGDTEQLNQMETVLLDIAHQTAHDMGLDLSIIRMHDIDAAPMSESFVKAVTDACDTLNLSHTQLLSFAGHDAQSMAKITHSVMYFVPSVDGISHNPKEFTRDEDCVNAANVMLHTVLKLSHSTA